MGLNGAIATLIHHQVSSLVTIARLGAGAGIVVSATLPHGVRVGQDP